MHGHWDEISNCIYVLIKKVSLSREAISFKVYGCFRWLMDTTIIITFISIKTCFFSHIGLWWTGLVLTENTNRKTLQTLFAKFFLFSHIKMNCSTQAPSFFKIGNHYVLHVPWNYLIVELTTVSNHYNSQWYFICKTLSKKCKKFYCLKVIDSTSRADLGERPLFELLKYLIMNCFCHLCFYLKIKMGSYHGIWKTAWRWKKTRAIECL